MKKATAFCIIVLLGILCVSIPQQMYAGNNQKWFRGQLHAHSYWSDGRAFPEQAIDAYKKRGYHFLSLTEHNRFADNKKVWCKVGEKEGGWPPKVTKSIFDNYVQKFGPKWVETKTNGKATSVRLKTYSEVKAKFEEPRKFILIPGVELTQTLNGIEVHLNYTNIPGQIPSIKGASLVKKIKNTKKTVADLLNQNVLEVRKTALKMRKPHIIMLNHPFWPYYNITPQSMIDCPGITFFEVCNNGAKYGSHPEVPNYTIEKFWDVVNAFRRIRKQPFLYGVGSDDAHYYDAKRIKGGSGVGDAWIMVRAAALTQNHLIAAMHKGDFYATNGVLLDELVFTRSKKTLNVKVKAEKGINYTIHFITTKRNFDKSVTKVASPANKGRPARTIPKYSDTIGQTVKSVKGISGFYKLEKSDLYVRARVESDNPSKITPHFHPKVKMAWTQPYAPSR